MWDTRVDSNGANTVRFHNLLVTKFLEESLHTMIFWEVAARFRLQISELQTTKRQRKLKPGLDVFKRIFGFSSVAILVKMYSDLLYHEK